MLNFNKTGLRIFDNFEVDESLPKHQAEGDLNVEIDSNLTVRSTGQGGTRVWTNSGNFSTSDLSDDIIIAPHPGMHIVAMKKDTLTSFLGRKLKTIGEKWMGFKGESKPKEENFIAPKMTVEEFFKSIKNTKSQLNKLDKRLEGYQVALQQAKDLGQVALMERLEGQIEVIRSESQLYANNMVKVVTEEQVVKFARDSEKGLCLDWIKNFTRQIPEKFVKVKKKLDGLKVFDNYVILHYDPEGKNSGLTSEEEVEKKKDPILFGVILNSRKLYYIGDWKDEYCDLTLDDFFDKFGKEAITKNNITVDIDVSNLGD